MGCEFQVPINCHPYDPCGRFLIYLSRFLLAQLYMGALVGKRSTRALRLALKGLTLSQQTYDRAYDEAMTRIERQTPDQAELAKQALGWIVCAKRQLTTHELQHALGVVIHERQLDQENIPDIADVVSVCAGLVTVDPQSEIIRLVHHTAQDYFERHKSRCLPGAERDITTVSVTYLLFDCFNGLCLTDQEFTARLMHFPLCLYVAKYWGFHFSSAADGDEQKRQIESLVLELLTDSCKLDFAVQALWSLKTGPNSTYLSQNPPKATTGLHLAAWFGMKDLTLRLIQRGFQVDAKDSKKSTPLSWAAQRGQVEVARLLLQLGADGDSRDQCGETPLSLAAWNGHFQMVQLLLEQQCNPNSKNNERHTPLLYAIEQRQECIARILIEAGAQLNAKDNFGRTPLSSAVDFREMSLVQHLLSSGADAKMEDECGQTPIFEAAAIGNTEVVSLLSNFTNVNARDRFGRTPLHAAAVGGHSNTIRFLITVENIDTTPQDIFGSTPLTDAIKRQNDEAAALLRQSTADLMDITGYQIHSPQEPRSGRMCDICLGLIMPCDWFYHCRICLGGDFDICKICVDCESHCLDGNHTLDRFQ